MYMVEQINKKEDYLLYGLITTSTIPYSWLFLFQEANDSIACKLKDVKVEIMLAG